MWKKHVILFRGQDLADFALQRRKPKGWMFWGCFAGRIKGPGFVWEKEYGGIGANNYIEHIIPLIIRFYRQIQASVFQQDNASAHRARRTKAALNLQGVNVVRWPPYSPDLSPIENVWPWIKNWIECNCEDIQELDLPDLRRLLEAAWEAVPEDLLLRLAHSMPRRLQMCIDAELSLIHI